MQFDAMALAVSSSACVSKHTFWQAHSADGLMNAAQRPQRRARSSLIASDFTLPRSRRRASSPGARSELSGRSRRVRRRLVRSGDRLQPERSLSGSQRLGSDADSILNALERSISARDYAGLSTTAEHRFAICYCNNSALQMHHHSTLGTSVCLLPDDWFCLQHLHCQAIISQHMGPCWRA